MPNARLKAARISSTGVSPPSTLTPSLLPPTSISARTRVGAIPNPPPRTIPPLQAAKWGCGLSQEGDDGLGTHAPPGVASYVDRYAVRFAGLPRDVLRSRAKLCI